MKKELLFAILFALLVSCKKDYVPVVNTPPVVTPKILLKDYVSQNLPSPYYHFEYDASREVSFISFASDFERYDVTYSQGRINEIRNNILVNKDRLHYFYNNEGKVELIAYADSTGKVYRFVDLFYAGSKLVRLERSRSLPSAGEVLEKTITFSYYPDDNLKDITYRFLPQNGQPETHSTSHFEQYDNKINVDAFSLLHDEFFDHLVFLPGVQLQKNNPAKETRTGDGLNYIADYSYDYNDKNAPVTRRANVQTNTGQVQFTNTFTYY